MTPDLITIDGVEFHWGMTIVNESGGEIVIKEGEYEFQLYSSTSLYPVCSAVPYHTDRATWVVSKKDAPHHYKLMIRSFYSSQAARIEWQIKRLELFKWYIDKDIAGLRAGVKPGHRMQDDEFTQNLPYLQDSYKITEIFEILTPQNCSWLRK